LAERSATQSTVRDPMGFCIATRRCGELQLPWHLRKATLGMCWRTRRMRHNSHRTLPDSEVILCFLSSSCYFFLINLLPAWLFIFSRLQEIFQTWIQHTIRRVRNTPAPALESLPYIIKLGFPICPNKLVRKMKHGCTQRRTGRT